MTTQQSTAAGRSAHGSSAGSRPPLSRRPADLLLGAAWQAGLAVFGLVFALLAIVWFVRPLQGDQAASAFASTLMFAAAAQASGAAFGFLFGVPRTRIVSAAPDSGSTASQTHIQGEPAISQLPNAPNTNLEQISDWLTKILVGVGLTQASAIAHGFESLVNSISQGLPVANAQPFVGALLLFSAVLGFLTGWVLARVWIARLLAASDGNMPGPRERT